MADALNRGADTTIITTGAVQSNHCRLTLAATVKEGLKCRLLLEERVPGTYTHDASGNYFLLRLLGADNIKVVEAGADIESELRKLSRDVCVCTAGGRPYIVPRGGSNELGALGYVAGAVEVAQLESELGLDFDSIVVPTGSGGTQAGLVAGTHVLSSETSIVGISVRADKTTQERTVHALATATLQSFEATLD